MNKKILLIFIIAIIAIFVILFFVNQKQNPQGSPNLVETTINTDDVNGKEIMLEYLKGQYGQDALIAFEFVSTEWIKGYVNDLVFYAKYFQDGWQTIYEGKEADIPCEEFKKYNMPYAMIDMCYTK